MIIKWKNEKKVAMQAGSLYLTRRSENGNDKGGYRFTYDGLNRLKKAQYLYGSAYHYNDFNEEVPQYDKNGNIMKLKRHAINWLTQGTGTGFLVDDLMLGYTGNQLTYLTDTIPASASFIGYVQPTATVPSNPVSYNGNGSAKYNYFNGIAGMSYNLLNLPEKIRFMFGHATQYSYDAAGAKRKTVHQTVAGNLFIPLGTTNYTPNPGDIQSTLTTDYCAGGHIVYENSALKMILNPEGYVIKQSNGTNTYYYYVKDYLGNNRSVFSATASTFGNVEQEMHYYPFGMPYQAMLLFWGGFNPEFQPYKFGGKELDPMHGLNYYDFHNRFYDRRFISFTTMDPLAEKYYSISPYVYCANNPVNAIDIDGRTDYKINENGYIFDSSSNWDKLKRLWNGLDKTDMLIARNGETFTMDAGTMSNFTVNTNDRGKKISQSFEVKDSGIAEKIHEFLSENVKNIEYGVVDATKKGESNSIITTTFQVKSNASTVAWDLSLSGSEVTRITHNHTPVTVQYPTPEDKSVVKYFNDNFPKNKIEHRIYLPKTLNYIYYNEKGIINTVPKK